MVIKMASIVTKRLIELREIRGLSQRAVAQRLGISNGTISRLESGQRIPNATTVKQLAEFYRVSTDYLMGVDDSINPKQVIPYDPIYDPIIEKLKLLDKRDLELVQMLIDNLLEKQNETKVEERKRA
ncbi:MAG: HTH-type transcriptional regulator ImmR [Tenericutes bacterium ADurb.BinA124]|nr:MAG: HTH-type transcriptional regulator ImmR [Tenericutes bacterium ADurb.BinA124]